MLHSLPAHLAPDPSAAAQVAGQIEVVARADRALARELDRIGTCRAPVCAETVLRLEALLVGLRDAAQVRAELARLDPDLLHAGAALWAGRPGPAPSGRRSR